MGGMEYCVAASEPVTCWLWPEYRDDAVDCFWLEDYLRERWRADREVVSLRYLWRPVELTIRRVHFVTRRTDPRWKAERWKAKT